MSGKRSSGGKARLRRAAAGLVILVAAAQGVSVAWALLPIGDRRFSGVRLSEIPSGAYQEVDFANPAAGLRLAGLLFVPEGPGPFPGAVIIHGSGTSQRDNGWYLTLVSYLRERGVAVLLPDKRGSEQSGGDWRTSSYEELATDALAALRFLSEQDRVDTTRVGLVGLSEGGHIAPLAAARSAGVDFVVNVVGAAVPMHELLVYEETHNLRQLGVLPGLSDLMAIGTAYALRKGSKRAFWDAVGNFDVLPHWRALSVDGLVLYGELDTNVPSAASAARLRSLGKPNIAVRVFEGSGHALEDPPEQGNSIFREDALEEIRAFVAGSKGGRR
ncbi:MAG: alpha/beta fold hydrolase [Gemmatimonadota bacterium]